MSDKQEPITEWLKRLPDGDSFAQHQIWCSFAEQVRVQAKNNLHGVPKSDSDEEDVAVRVFNSLFQRLVDGRQQKLANRKQLWNLLLGMTRNKSAELARRKLAKKRGVGETHQARVNEDGNCELSELPGSDPDPKTAFAELQSFAEMMDAMQSQHHRQIVLLRMAGHNDGEISKMLCLGLRTVQRRLQEVREQLADLEP